MYWGPQAESHLVGVNRVAILLCIDGGQGGGHSKSDQCHRQRVGQKPGQHSQVGEVELGESGERGIQGEDGLGLRRIWGRQRKQGGAHQEELLGGRSGRRAVWCLDSLTLQAAAPLSGRCILCPGKR